jgi:hypothetical protein
MWQRNCARLSALPFPVSFICIAAEAFKQNAAGIWRQGFQLASNKRLKSTIRASAPLLTFVACHGAAAILRRSGPQIAQPACSAHLRCGRRAGVA